MTYFKDKTFCSGAGCFKFSTCPFALTEKVLEEATRWWGDRNAPISRFSDPTKLECYAGPTQKMFLAEGHGEPSRGPGGDDRVD